MAASAKEVVRAFFDSFNQGNVDAVVALYEPNAKLVAQPGQVAEGHGAIREALNGFLAMKPTLTPGKNEVIETGDIALSIISWTLKGTGPDGNRCSCRARAPTSCASSATAAGASSSTIPGAGRSSADAQTGEVAERA